MQQIKFCKKEQINDFKGCSLLLVIQNIEFIGYAREMINFLYRPADIDWQQAAE